MSQKLLYAWVILLPEGKAQNSAFTKGQIGKIYFSARDYQIYLYIYVLAEANRVIQETQQFVQQITPAVADFNLSKCWPRFSPDAPINLNYVMIL